jgi:hypothetical protein
MQHFDQVNNAVRGKSQLLLGRLYHLLRRDRFRREQFEITQVEIKLAGLHADLSGYRLVQITDLHVGHWLSVERLYGVVELVNEQQADCVVITGDFVSYVVEEIAADLTQALSQIQAPDGVLAVLGNHDHWMGVERVREILHQAGVIELANTIHPITRGDGKLIIAGVDDILVGQDRLDEVIQSLPEDIPVVLLAHEPDYADQAAASQRFGLMLSGHSHGGQVVLPRLGTVLRGAMFKRYPNGRYQVGNMVQYTNRGVGTHSLRLRINCPPEIAVFTLMNELE